jgi:hypothetical protein
MGGTALKHLGFESRRISKEAGVNVEKMPDDTNWLDLYYEN